MSRRAPARTGIPGLDGPGSTGRNRTPLAADRHGAHAAYHRAMLLTIDIGNTNITTGLFQNGLLVATRRASTNRAATPDELELLIEGLLGLDTLDLRGIAAIACASVVPGLTTAIESIAIRRDLAL